MNPGDPKFSTHGAIPLVEPDLLSSILSVSSDLALVVGPDDKVVSVIVSANDRSYGNLSHWEGRDARDFLTPESRPKLTGALGRARGEGGPSRPIELNHKDNARWEFPVRYTLHPIGGEGAILMVGRDLRPIAETQQRLVEAQLALERGYEARREADTRYRVLLTAVPDALIFAAAESGRILDLNEAAAVLLGSSAGVLTGARLTAEIDTGRGTDPLALLTGGAGAEDGAAIEASARRTGAAIRIVPVAFRAGGARTLLLRLSAAGEAASAPSDRLLRGLTTLFHQGAEAIAMTDGSGVIEAVNDAFLDLAGIAGASDARGRSLGEFLGRGQVDLGVLVETARRDGRLRMHATTVTGPHGAGVAVEATATWLPGRDAAQIGVVFRDAEGARSLRGVAASAAQSDVAQLVGSATLKEIVAETTDVIERMCIETAVSLTNNNRVAAAEMLGLSRQSLYVKLRKYDLL